MLNNYFENILASDYSWFYRGNMVTRALDFLCDLIMYSLYIKLLSWFLYMKLKLKSRNGRLTIAKVTWIKIYWVMLITALTILNQLIGKMIGFFRDLAYLE